MDIYGDVRLAVRSLRATPSYTVASIVTLALAIAATSAIFSAVYGILLRPLPIRNAGELVVGWETDTARGTPVAEVTYNHYRAWSRETRSFSHLAAMGSSTWSAVVEGRGNPVRIASTAVSDSFFDTLGTSAQLGRTFTSDDDDEKAGRVVVLNDGLWRDRFGADASVIGSRVVIDRIPHTIIGVMPRDFEFPRGTDVWIPLLPVLRASSASWKTDVLENVRVLYIVGRLRPGVTRAVARDDLDAVAARHPHQPGVRRVSTLTPLLDYLLGPLRAGLWWLLAGAGILLALACANVSGLALTRATLRQREHAVRLALGATRVQIGRGWLAETLLIAAAGGALGLVAARWLLSAILRLAPDDVPRLGDVGINLPVAAVTLLVVALTALVCAAAAGIHASRAPIGELLAEGAHSTAGRSTQRTRSILVISQVALAVILLICAGLVMRSFANLQRLDLGFDRENVMTIQVEPAAIPVPAREWFNELIDRIERLPGVESAGAVSLPPLAYGAIGTEQTVILEGQPFDTAQGGAQDATDVAARNPKLNFQVATPGYFRAMRIALLRGRLFEGHDRFGAPRVVVVGERTANRLWPGEDPIGKRINTPQTRRDAVTSDWHTVIGVVKDVHYRGIGDVRFDLYEPAAQSYRGAEFLIVRTAGNPLGIVAAVQAQVRALDRRAVIGSVTTLETVVTRALAPWRLSSWILLVFAMIAFVLAMVGLVGLLSLEVAHRAREFSLRLALGAQAQHLRNGVLRSAAARGGSGIVLGVGSALAVTGGMRVLLFGVAPTDLSTYAAVVAIVCTAVIAASSVPALRAAATNPIEILRRE